MLKTVGQLHIFVETVIHFVFQDYFDEQKVDKNSINRNRNFCNIINIFNVTFEYFIVLAE